ncbi:MAG: IS66 family transposase [Pseudomonadota bacterium]|nr:IS66 family transposase [Pseudomonadota bacterium]
MLGRPPQEDPPAGDKPVERSATGRKGHGRRNLFLDESVPVGERIVHDVSEEEKFCADCGQGKKPMPPKITRKLTVIPARLYAVEHVRLQYSCPCCMAAVSTAALPPAVVERGLASPELLAHVAVSKYADFLPLNRQEGIFARQGAVLPRSTLCGWLRETARELGILPELMARRQTEAGFLHIDETPLPVQAPGRARTAWLWTAVGDREAPYTVYHFRNSRGRAGPEEFLEGFRGTLQSDAYAVYAGLCSRLGLVSAGCWAHARRKFVDAHDKTRASRAREAVEKIAALYDVERQAAELADGERLQVREEKSRPLAEALFAWLEEVQMEAPPQSALGKACAYALSNRTQLSVFLSDGRVPLDNNAAERAIRPTVIGRKNWLFAGSDEGGRTAAVFFSLIESAKRHGLNVFDYLADVIRRLPSWPVKRLEELLPDRWTPAARDAATAAAA